MFALTEARGEGMIEQIPQKEIKALYAHGLIGP